VSRTKDQIIGSRAEQKAQRFLEGKGLIMRNKNWRGRFGELDLVMTDQEVLVVVEVRWRSGRGYGSAVESVTKDKQRKIITATKEYVSKTNWEGEVRFDVIGMSESRDGERRIEYIEDAFYDK